MERGDRAALQRELVELADGNRDAFHPAFLRLWPIVRAFVARHLGGPDADDVAQEALIKVFTRVGEYDATRDALAWVLGVALWEIRTARSRERRRKDRAEAPEALTARADGGPSPEALAIQESLEAALGCALGALGPRDAETLLAFARGERPAVPAATFRKRVERALGRLRRIWSRTHGLD